MLRNSWRTELPADIVFEATQGKTTHHKARLEFYDLQLKSKMEEVKASGLELRNIPDPRLSRAYENERQSQIYVRNDLSEDLRRISSKVEEHKLALQTYEIWANFLKNSEKMPIPLDFEDYNFFFSKAPTFGD